MSECNLVTKVCGDIGVGVRNGVGVFVGVGKLATDTNKLKWPQNGRAHIRHTCRKTTVLRCHRCLINTGVKKMNKI